MPLLLQRLGRLGARRVRRRRLGRAARASHARRRPTPAAPRRWLRRATCAAAWGAPCFAGVGDGTRLLLRQRHQALGGRTTRQNRQRLRGAEGSAAARVHGRLGGEAMERAASCSHGCSPQRMACQASTPTRRESLPAQRADAWCRPLSHAIERRARAVLEPFLPARRGAPAGGAAAHAPAAHQHDTRPARVQATRAA